MNGSSSPSPGDPTVEARFRALCDLVTRLRSPGGCPWDRTRQANEVGHDLIEEAYEVLGALAGADASDLKEELGDLIFEILFLARIAEEEGRFDIGTVLETVHEKMIRRHPHVFGDAGPMSVAEVRQNWGRIKREVEGRTEPPSLDENLTENLPTLARVQQLSARASRRGFDWPDIIAVLAKVEEETAEFRAAHASGDRKRIEEEAGDLLFTVVNLCRFSRIDAEASLRSALKKFNRRFARLEEALAAQGQNVADTSAAELDRLWNAIKRG